MNKKMKIGIRYRLFFAFLTTACCVIISMFIVTRESFERGVFRYVNQVEKERLEILARTLEQVYGQKKGWTFLEQSPISWLEVVAGSKPERPRHFDDRLKSANLTDEQDSPLDPPPPPMPKGKQSFELRVLLQDAGRQLLYGPAEPWVKPPVFVS